MSEIALEGVLVTNEMLRVVAIIEGSRDEYAHWPGVNGPKEVLATIASLQERASAFLEAAQTHVDANRGTLWS